MTLNMAHLHDCFAIIWKPGFTLVILKAILKTRGGRYHAKIKICMIQGTSDAFLMILRIILQGDEVSQVQGSSHNITEKGQPWSNDTFRFHQYLTL